MWGKVILGGARGVSYAQMTCTFARELSLHARDNFLIFRDSNLFLSPIFFLRFLLGMVIARQEKRSHQPSIQAETFVIDEF